MGPTQDIIAYLISIPLHHAVSIIISFQVCNASYCQNGGRCNEGVSNISCSCLQGFEGNQCEISKSNYRYFDRNLLESQLAMTTTK